MFVKKLEATKLITSGNSAKLECKATGSPVIGFKWFKDEMEISSGPKYAIALNDLVASLQIVDCKVEDSGEFVCTAANEAGSDRTSSTVTVKGQFSLTAISDESEVNCNSFTFPLVEPPIFIRSLEPKDVVKGSEMMLEGQVSGSAPFTVCFYKNTKPIRNDKRHRITVKDSMVALQVLAVEAGDVGPYQCTVENEVGRVSCDCQVTLKGWSRYSRLKTVF